MSTVTRLAHMGTTQSSAEEELPAVALNALFADADSKLQGSILHQHLPVYTYGAAW